MDEAIYKLFCATLMVEPYSIIQQHIMKQLEYVTKDPIAMYTILFELKIKWLYSLVSWWNNPKSFICSPSQPSLNISTSVYAHMPDPPL